MKRFPNASFMERSYIIAEKWKQLTEIEKK